MSDELRTAAIEAAAKAIHATHCVRSLDVCWGPTGHELVAAEVAVDAILPLLVAGTASRIADAIEAEPNSHRVHFTDEDGNKDYVDQAHGSKHYAAIARRVGETS